MYLDFPSARLGFEQAYGMPKTRWDRSVDVLMLEETIAYFYQNLDLCVNILLRQVTVDLEPAH